MSSCPMLLSATLSNGSNIGRIGLGVLKSPADEVIVQAVKKQLLMLAIAILMEPSFIKMKLS